MPRTASQKTQTSIRPRTVKITSRLRWPLVHRGQLTDVLANAASPEHTVVVEQKVVNLALQGGGSHGAFTWGVLDRLLEEERLSFDGISASSAGSINAVVLAHGLAAGGRDEARNAMRLFWKRMSETTSHGVLQQSWFDKLNGKFGLEHSPGYLFLNSLMYFTSPDFYNPLNG